MKLPAIKALVLDVDGVLTAGRVTHDEEGQRVMSFSIHDGSAIKRWVAAGGRCAIISGRRSPIVDRRASELGVGMVAQGVECKERTWRRMMAEMGFSDADSCCIGDDVGDVDIVRQCGFGVAVANAVPQLKRWADYVTIRRGGDGAVAEVVDALLRSGKV